MKGISLAIDTTMIIILALIVLVVLIGILFMVSPGFIETIKAESTRASNCAAYLRTDDNCDLKEYDNFIKDSNNEKLVMVKELGTACSALRISGCSKDTASRDCIRACCIGCGATTTTKT